MVMLVGVSLVVFVVLALAVAASLFIDRDAARRDAGRQTHVERP